MAISKIAIATITKIPTRACSFLDSIPLLTSNCTLNLYCKLDFELKNCRFRAFPSLGKAGVYHVLLPV